MTVSLFISVLVVLGATTLICDATVSSGGVRCVGCRCNCVNGTLTQDTDPTPNGCAAIWIPNGMENLVDNFGFQSCCDKHAECLGTCGKHRNQCDGLLARCLYYLCAKQPSCGIRQCHYVRSYFFRNVRRECNTYENAQQLNCKCVV